MNNKWSLVIGLAVGVLVLMVGLTGRGQADIRTQDLVATLRPTQDTSIFSGTPNDNSGGKDASWLWVGDGSGFGEERALIQFSFTSPTAPISTTIQQALLWLTLDKSASGYTPGALSISIHRVTQPWTETATWNQMAEKFAESYATVTVGHTQSCAFDITGLVQAWRAYDAGAGGYQNFGLMVKATTFVRGIQKIFFSKEAETGPNPIPGAQGPVLQLYSGGAGAPTPTPTLPPLPNRLFMPLVSRTVTCP